MPQRASATVNGKWSEHEDAQNANARPAAQRRIRRWKVIMFDAIQKLAWDSETAVAVLANDNDVELVDLNQPASPARLRPLARRGLQFYGCLALVDGKVRVEIEGGLLTVDALRVMTQAAATFAARRVAPKDDGGDGADWLERLHRLPDPRG